MPCFICFISLLCVGVLWHYNMYGRGQVGWVIESLMNPARFRPYR